MYTIPAHTKKKIIFLSLFLLFKIIIVIMFFCTCVFTGNVRMNNRFLILTMVKTRTA